ncbi:MAG: hypothetical protein KDK89_10245 [Alphaproteobacteria bacterium]|nr:hypothetical protein [Alphaproteobacteria bacterium]
MLRLALIGVWVAIVTAGSAFLSFEFVSSRDVSSSDQETEDRGVEELKTEMTSVPMVRGGEILGYVIIQLSFAADRARLEELNLEPVPYLVDAIFRAVYSFPEVDFRRVRAKELDLLTESITKLANERMGGAVVRTALIQQLNFVRKEDIRTNWIGKQGDGQ